jgi:hypothetical protein
LIGNLSNCPGQKSAKFSRGKNPVDIHTSVAANFVNKVTNKTFLICIPKVSDYREVQDEKVGGIPHLGVENHDQHHQQVTQES